MGKGKRGMSSSARGAEKVPMPGRPLYDAAAPSVTPAEPAHNTQHIPSDELDIGEGLAPGSTATVDIRLANAGSPAESATLNLLDELGEDTLRLLITRDAMREHQRELMTKLREFEHTDQLVRWEAAAWLAARSISTDPDELYDRVEDLDQLVHENARELAHHPSPRPDATLKALAQERLILYLADLITRRGRILPKDVWREWTDLASLPFKPEDANALNFARQLLATQGALICIHFGAGADASELEWQGRLLGLPAKVVLCRYRGTLKELGVQQQVMDL